MIFHRIVGQVKHPLERRNGSLGADDKTMKEKEKNGGTADRPPKCADRNVCATLARVPPRVFDFL